MEQVQYFYKFEKQNNFVNSNTLVHINFHTIPYLQSSKVAPKW
jgi:hypothetical protein